MRTIAIINQKGGCGKTTVSINLAAVLAKQGRRTLLVDMDPQSHCALGLAVPESQIDQSVADMLRCGLDGTMAFADLIWQISRNLDLAPSTMQLAAIEQEIAQAPDRDRRLAQILSTVADSYDYCIIDCPPSIGLLTFNALRAADEIIVPVETGYFSMQGAIKQQQTIEMLVRRTGHNVRHTVLATMYDVRTKLAREILSELRRAFGKLLLPIIINFNSKLKEAASFGQPITEYDPTSRGMQDFEQLAGWLESNPPVSPIEQEQQATTNPALSRAAELVERARALSARTSALAARIASDPHVARTGEMQTDEDLPATHQPPAEQTPKPVVNDRLSVHLKRDHSDSQQHAAEQGSVATATHVQTRPRQAAQQQTSKLYGVRPTSQGMLFVQPIDRGEKLSIVGDFNNWSAAATPLKRNDDLGVWQACVPMEAGRYRYRLVVDGKWEQDKYNQTVEVNPFGEMNNVVEVAG